MMACSGRPQRLLRRWHLLVMLIMLAPAVSAADTCGAQGVFVQILGSGGPELSDRRASASYLVWIDGRAKLLIDAGGGSLLHYERSGAALNDLDAVLLSHLHVDHTSDLPALIKANYFSGRARNLLVFGPTGNALMPSTTAFIGALFGESGAYRYLSGNLSGASRYQLVPRDVDASGAAPATVLTEPSYTGTAVPVAHGPLPALAWRLDIGARSVVFSGDMSGANATLTGLAEEADLLIAHHAIPEGTTGAGRRLHMPPSVIGTIAANANIGKLVLSHRMTRTLGREAESTAEIRRRYRGELVFAEDLQCFAL